MFGWVKCVFTLLLFINCAAAQDVELPAPTGPHATGRMSLHWKDAARDELETSAPDDKRELMVHLFYPRDARANAKTEANRPGRLQTIADTRKWKRAFFDGAVRGDWGALNRLAHDQLQPEVTVHQFGKLWSQ